MPWLEFFLHALRRQMQRLRVRVEREKLMIGEVSALQAQLIELARTQGRLTIGDAATVTGVSRNTLKVQFRVLVRDGRMALNGAGRGAWYSIR